MKTALFLFIKQHQELCFSVLMATVTSAFTSCSSSPTPVAAAEADDVATFIPAGHSLVPIEIANYQTLDSLFGPFGVVDLYVQDPTADKHSRAVAKFVKVVRAPRNQSHFAALVPLRNPE